jgi:hypothetical protein
MIPKSEVKVGLTPPFMCITCVEIEIVVPSDPIHSLPPHQKKRGQSWIMPTPDSVTRLTLKM